CESPALHSITSSAIASSVGGTVTRLPRRSFDDLIGAGLQRERHVQPQSFGGPQVDDELELGGLLNRQLGWLGAVQNATDVGRGAAKQIGEIGAIGQQASARGKQPVGVGRRQAMSV